MDKLPNIVRQRLAAQPRAGDHPDADQLAALAEQQLDGAERTTVLAHLATCADCREIVTFAAPETAVELSAVTSVREAGPRWWAVPAFQWGAAAAAMAMIALGLFVLNPAQRQTAGRTEPSAAVTKAEPQTRSALQKQPPAVVSPKEADKVASSDLKRERAEAGYLSPQPDAVGGGVFTVAKPGKVSGSVVQDKAKPAADGDYAFKDATVAAKSEPLAESAPRSANETVAVKSTAEAVNANQPEKKADRANARLAAAVPAAPAAVRRAEGSGNSKAMAPEQQEVISNTDSRAADELAAGKAGAAVETQRTKMTFAKTQVTHPFRIASGRLQRFDATKNSWDDVSVGSAARLSIVGALANEVWVGGADGAIFYSNDLGTHWVPITTGGWSKDATFTGLTPTARQSVEVYLSNGERWRSADAGASWTRYQ